MKLYRGYVKNLYFLKFAEIKFEKIIFMLFIKQISKSLCFLFFLD